MKRAERCPKELALYELTNPTFIIYISIYIIYILAILAIMYTVPHSKKKTQLHTNSHKQ